MKIAYDKQADAMYIHFDENMTSSRTVQISEDVLIDYSKAGKVVGIEVLAASEYEHTIPHNIVKAVA